MIMATSQTASCEGFGGSFFYNLQFTKYLDLKPVQPAALLGPSSVQDHAEESVRFRRNRRDQALVRLREIVQTEGQVPSGFWDFKAPLPYHRLPTQNERFAVRRYDAYSPVPACSEDYSMMKDLVSESFDGSDSAAVAVMTNWLFQFLHWPTVKLEDLYAARLAFEIKNSRRSYYSLSQVLLRYILTHRDDYDPAFLLIRSSSYWASPTHSARLGLDLAALFFANLTQIDRIKNHHAENCEVHLGPHDRVYYPHDLFQEAYNFSLKPIDGSISDVLDDVSGHPVYKDRESVKQWRRMRTSMAFDGFINALNTYLKGVVEGRIPFNC